MKKTILLLFLFFTTLFASGQANFIYQVRLGTFIDYNSNTTYGSWKIGGSPLGNYTVVVRNTITGNVITTAIVGPTGVTIDLINMQDQVVIIEVTGGYNNFKKFYWDSSNDRSRLLLIARWGTNTQWNDCAGAFENCSNLQIAGGAGLLQTGSVQSFARMFKGCTSLFDVSLIEFWDITASNVSEMFRGCANLKLAYLLWNLSSINNFSYMFDGCSNSNFNPAFTYGPGTAVGAINMEGMFKNCTYFNYNLSNWNVSQVTNMASMFEGATNFNQPIGNWNVSNVTNMSSMFANATNFNQAIGGWSVSNVTNMSSMFANATNFNQAVGSWSVSNVTNMSSMFANAPNFNQAIGSWNVSNVTNMSRMFANATNFNQALNNWSVSNVTNMSNMFANATNFNQAVGNWLLNANVNLIGMLVYCGMNCSNYDTTLIGWSNNPSTPLSSNLGASGRKYSSIAAQNARTRLTISVTAGGRGWIISNDVLETACAPFANTDNVTTITACNIYRWADTGQTYTASGTYFGQITNAVTNKLNLSIITPYAVNSPPISACDSYTWPLNNQTYTSSGLYYRSTAVSGVIDNLAAWNLNAQYAQATVSSNNLSGQPNGPNLNLTIGTTAVNISAVGGLYNFPSFVSTFSQNQPITITFNPPVYGVLGNYFITDQQGNVIAANVSVNYSNGTSVNRTVATNANSFGFFDPTLISSVVISTTQTNGAFYVSLNNLRLATNPNLCATNKLDLTITPSSINTNTITACGSYLWNGTTYTSTGVYTGTTTNCVTQKLNLTITPTTVPTLTQVAAICSGSTISPLPTTSINGITGTWSPAFNNTATTTYTFTPNVTECAIASTMTIVVNNLPIISSVTASPAVTCSSSITQLQANATIQGPIYNGNSVVIEDLSTSVSSLTVSGLPTTPITGSKILVKVNLVHTYNGDLVIRLKAPNGANILLAQNLGGGTDNYTNTVFSSNAPSSIVTAVGPFTGTFQPQGLADFNALSTNPNGVWQLLVADTITGDTGFLNSFSIEFLPENLNYEWTVNPASALSSLSSTTIANPIATVNASATYTVKVTNNATGCFATRNIPMVITPNSNNVTTISNCGSYTWANNGQTYTTSGVYTGTTTNCVTQKLNLTITNTNPPTAVSNQAFCAGEPLSNIAITGTGIVWYDAATAGTVLPASTAIQSGTTYYSAQTVNGCESNIRTAITMTNGACLGKENFNEASFNYYPNPTEGKVFFSYTKPIEKISVSNILGQVILENKNNTNEAEIDLSSFASGTYLVKVFSDNQTNVIKILKR